MDRRKIQISVSKDRRKNVAERRMYLRIQTDFVVTMEKEDDDFEFSFKRNRIGEGF